MQIIINIDEGLVNRFKKSITLKRAALALMIFVISASALLFAATKPHTFTPGTTISSSQVNENFDAAFEAVAKAVPPGTVMAYAGTTVPEGYLLCDGSSVSRTTYANLFAAIGTIYGTGDGSTTFNLPDYRGLFLRGHHYGATIDPDYSSRIFGSIQNHMFQDHGHYHRHQSPIADGQYAGCSIANNSCMSVNGYVYTNYDDSGASKGNFGTETRPINRSVSYIIKH
mgnify:CR=1 FL=1